jgi:hypothetical protein
MNSKVRNALLLVSIIIVIVIFIDLIFNFSGLVVEKFSGGYNLTSKSQNNDENDDEFDHTKIKSLVSKNDGKAFNVKFIQSDPTNRTVVVYSPVSKNANISVNSDGTLSEELKMSTNPAQQFKLYKVTDGQTYNELLGENSIGANEFSSDTKYPFYILKSVLLGTRCLTYEPGNLFTTPIGNYSNQKWDVSQMGAPKLSVVTHNVEDNALGSLNKNGDGSDGELFDPNKIKINLNLTDELKHQLLGVNPNILSGSASGNRNSNNSQNSQTCGTFVPKDSLVSLCRGCDPNKL